MPSPLQGLTKSEVLQLQAQHGLNELAVADKKTLFKLLLRILSEPTFALLLLAGSIYLVIGKIDDALILIGFICISVGITLFQERKSEKAIDALKELSSPRAIVIRDSITQRIAGKDIVVGDILLLAEGDRIPADALLLESHDLLVDESLLTGESEPTIKDSASQVHSGCMVIRGSGIARVTAIGMQTELGKIGSSLKQIISLNSPLQEDIGELIKRVTIFGVSLSIIVLAIYGLMHDNWLQGALTAISLTMALLPEEFTVILTVFMALGVWRIARQKVLTRYAPVIETLGSITALCVDKTGTLTLNRMSLEVLATPQNILMLSSKDDELNPSQKELLGYCVLASEVKPFDPMEQAFYEKRHLAPEYINQTSEFELVHEYGLSPELPAMTHLWKASDSNQCLVAIKGAPEAVLKRCNLSQTQMAVIEKQIKDLASQGLRLLGVAKAQYMKQSSNWPANLSSFEFTWLGLVGLKDPIREEVPASIQKCQRAGIRVIMITGDHAITAQAIAKQAGIDSASVLSGSDINTLNDLELREAVKKTSVYVRIKPTEKLRLVKALQANNEVVAMTGDGVNDAPALKAAHVGIAMGQRGTDVAREAASLVLLNDDFSSIVHTIQQGRQIYDNLHKAIIYVVAVHIPMAGAVFIPILFGVQPILDPIHIVFLQMIIDPACAIIFEMEAPESDVMLKPPRSINQKLFSFQSISMALLQGAGLTTIVVGLYFWLLNMNYSHAMATTLSFGSLVLGNISLIIVSRSKNDHLLRILQKTNPSQKWILGIGVISFGFLITIPFLRDRFQFTVPTLEGALVILASGLIGITWYELVKLGYRRKWGQ
ncbi:cation-translocating P-type ATPase [Polynucleobacter sp. MWH-Aus1W21]|uniref:cation-translocating P-type ATPase n=1 Tax=Polynucleobacter sp. MWH-Aus1W21 TaxID=1855880 RepID=UPI001BFE5C38|nr:cation-translocating P-type ATPase [Polynucleobacter sp. MWH-Aus1W21]QWD67143.1 cation-translocating P-type ATPase [Polynucleobacter sp. MWH-Aus1W21]